MNLELYLEQMKELVNIDSGSGNVAGINRVADKLAGWYQEIGWNVERIPADGGSSGSSYYKSCIRTL